MADPKMSKAMEQYRSWHRVMAWTDSRCIDCGLGLDAHRERFGRSLLLHRLDPSQPPTPEGCVPVCQYCHADRIWARRHPQVGYKLYIRLLFDEQNRGVATALRHHYGGNAGDAVVAAIDEGFRRHVLPGLDGFRPRCVAHLADPRPAPPTIPGEPR